MVQTESNLTLTLLQDQNHPLVGKELYQLPGSINFPTHVPSAQQFIFMYLNQMKILTSINLFYILLREILAKKKNTLNNAKLGSLLTR